MYRTRVINVKEKPMFNNFVESHDKGHFLQLWEWGMVKKGMGWEMLPLVLEKDGEVKASLLILKRRLPLPGINKSIFYAPRGPVADIHDEEINRLLFEGAERLAREHGAIFLKIDPDVSKDEQIFADILKKCGFRKNETGLDFEGVQPNFVMRLDINQDEEALLKNMHSKWRYNIRLAERRGVKIREARGKEDLKVFYEILQETAQRDNFLIRGYEYYEWIWDYMIEAGYAKIFMAEYEGEVIAGTIAMRTGRKVWYLYGASSNRHRNVMPNYLLQWHMIKWAKEMGCTLYDFRGVSGDLDENNPLYGLYRFKKGFGAELTEFIGEWDKVYSPFFYFLWTKILPVYLKITRKRLKKPQNKEE
ncbi:peptidoglycan bridge formation glycyltransferase FemA/FemB family protein [Thermosyntropha sp.]|uniref:lipid II:glycine glycyltransferase FemX n=1 Tax=Thermosyntropha sp. TaxID=2740820 RepID=UPI0025ECB7C3|nr:peptidoglycan bridge formation glycyltransferase FemA/FemB family protein [Thermosyntropha sp.]MBO8157946.1 peptidoglycan bridge formation glycyltransferase FemA/FemB family protein [Thermosyntropha sp.]